MSEWISCDHTFPENGVCVDAWGYVVGGYNHGDEVRVENCFFDSGLDRFWKWNETCDEEVLIQGFHVTHWMPLPEPPK